MVLVGGGRKKARRWITERAKGGAEKAIIIQEMLYKLIRSNVLNFFKMKKTCSLRVKSQMKTMRRVRQEASRRAKQNITLPANHSSSLWIKLMYCMVLWQITSRYNVKQPSFALKWKCWYFRNKTLNSKESCRGQCAIVEFYTKVAVTLFEYNRPWTKERRHETRGSHCS